MTDRELMQQALDALEDVGGEWGFTSQRTLPKRMNAIEALRARLAQPEQEPVATLFGSLPVYDVPPAKPVAWVENLENARPHCVTDLKYCSVAQHERGEHLKYIPLYTSPPQRSWQGLTDEDCEEVERWVEFKEDGSGRIPTLKLTRYIEAKLKEKNND